VNGAGKGFALQIPLEMVSDFLSNCHHNLIQALLGYPDYLCVANDGSVDAWINQGSLWWDEKQHVKESEGFDQSEIRFADIDGNGKSFMAYLKRQKLISEK
jgi:hypothetical protein